MLVDNHLITQWPFWKKIVFRFFIIYLILQMQPWGLVNGIPGASYITEHFDKVFEWTVKAMNAYIFHVKDELVLPNGSGDTSFAWAQLFMILTLAILGSLIWSMLDKKRTNYQRLNYWLCLITRYYVCYYAFIYGLLKVFALQMFFPNLSQLSTPLGDFLPMRLSWMFIGYSTPYQVFSGIMEVVAGCLLLFRRTVTLGILLAAAVFTNVMMLNLAYDVPVKLFSSHLLLMCLFLLMNEYHRLFSFFILNRPEGAATLYDFPFHSKKSWRSARIVLKSVFIILGVALPLYNDITYYRSVHLPEKHQDIPTGIYDVRVFVVNKDTLPFALTDSLRWQDIIFDKASLGSVRSTDTLFRQRYRRGYFYYSFDSAHHSIGFKKYQTDTMYFARFEYSIPDSNRIQLRGRRQHDSLYLELYKNNRHFQLAERQFHWLSEANR